MMPKSISYHEELIESLKDSSEAAVYLEVVLEEGDPQMIKKALANVIQAQKGVKGLPNNLKKEFYEVEKKILETGDIELQSLCTLLDFLGLKVSFTVTTV
ncbi:MAG: hypothetical protein SVX43_11430 [Cyanobacteriota bacterium]|nr:hypothetical protein [Cyanobacteriota bacterium]